MSIGNQITGKLNSLERFIESSPFYYLPLKLLGWAVLLLALMVTNLLAIIRWPVSALARRTRSTKRRAGEPVEIGAAHELERLTASDDIVLIDFWAQWCGPCLLMNKTLKTVAERYADSATLAKVDVSINSQLRNAYNVKGLPTVIVMKNGREVARKAGSLTINQLSSLIESAKQP